MVSLVDRRRALGNINRKAAPKIEHRHGGRKEGTRKHRECPLPPAACRLHKHTCAAFAGAKIDSMVKLGRLSRIRGISSSGELVVVCIGLVM